MSFKFLPLVLISLFILSPLQELKATDLGEEELKRPEQGRRGLPPKMGFNGTLDSETLQKKLATLKKDKKRAEAPSKTSSSSSSRDKTSTHKTPIDSSKPSPHHHKPLESSRDHKPSKRVYDSKPTHKNTQPPSPRTEINLVEKNEATSTPSVSQHVYQSQDKVALSKSKENEAKNKAKENTGTAASLNHRNAMDVAPFMPSPKKTPPVVVKSSSASRSAHSKPLKDKQKQESGQEGGETEVSSKKGASIDEISLKLGIKMPESSKALFAPKELPSFYLFLALAAGTSTKVEEDPISKVNTPVIKTNKIYIPSINMFLGYKIMQAGTLDTLKSKLLYDEFSQMEAVQKLLKLIRITSKEDMSRTRTARCKDEAQQAIITLAEKYFLRTKLTTKYAEIDKREDNTLGQEFKGNYAIYDLYEDKKLIPNLQVRIALATPK